MKFPFTATLTIQRLAEGGQGLAVKDGKSYLVWNALPGEEITAIVHRKKRRCFECTADNILKKSGDRIGPAETHFLSCSPWQILSWPAENKAKQQLAFELIREVFPEQSKEPPRLVYGEKTFGYRNKMEYSLISTPAGPSLAFFERGTRRKGAIMPCRLAEQPINETAGKILSQLQKIAMDPSKIKSLILRCDSQGRVLAGLFVKEDVDWNLFTPEDLGCEGFWLYYSNPQSPASICHRLIGHWGKESLMTTIRQKHLHFGLMSFFQVHREMFEKALEDIVPYLDTQRRLVDYYSGLGAISLSLAGHYRETMLIDNDAENIRFAERNIQENRVENAKAVLCDAQKMTELIEKDSIVLFDPPRCGLHPKLIRQILSQRPIRILYLSCNPLSQAKDLESLKGVYTLKMLRCYNFFPRTPHLECLCVLDRT